MRLDNLVYNNNSLKGSRDVSGVYRARVEDVKDPMGIGRVRVRVPKFHGIEGKGGLDKEGLPWATLLSQSAGYNYGTYMVPEVGEFVMVQFEDSDPYKPVCLGSLYGNGPREEKKYETAGEEWSSPVEEMEVPYDAQRDDVSMRMIYKSPKGAEIYVDEMEGSENVSIIDSLGQRIVLNSPNGKGASHEERITNGQANITITGLNGQMIDLNSTHSETEISIISKECALTLKPDSEGVSIFSNNACIVLDRDGNINISGKTVNISASELVDIECEKEIVIMGEHVTIGKTVTILEEDGGGEGSNYEGMDRDPNLVDISEIMKDVDVSDWMAVVAKMKEFMSNASGVYDQGGYVRFTLGGKSFNVRTDCSGFVSGCLNLYGAMNGMTSSAGLMSMGGLKGFTKANFTSWSDLRPGDILVTNGHTEIYAGESNGRHMVYNYGSNASAEKKGATGTNHSRYTYVYRPNGK